MGARKEEMACASKGDISAFHRVSVLLRLGTADSSMLLENGTAQVACLVWGHQSCASRCHRGLLKGLSSCMHPNSVSLSGEFPAKMSSSIHSLCMDSSCPGPFPAVVFLMPVSIWRWSCSSKYCSLVQDVL